MSILKCNNISGLNSTIGGGGGKQNKLNINEAAM